MKMIFKFKNLLLITATLCFISGCSQTIDSNKSVNSSNNMENASLEKSSDEKYDLKLTRMYREIIKDFKRVTPTEINNNQLESDSLLYFGRESCPFCKEFVPVLKEALDYYSPPFTVYYFDTENSQNNNEIQEIMKKYNVEGVPTSVYLKKDGSFEILNENETTLPEWIAQHKQQNKVTE